MFLFLILTTPPLAEKLIYSINIMTKNNNSHYHLLSACQKRAAFNAYNVKVASTSVSVLLVKEWRVWTLNTLNRP